MTFDGPIHLPYSDFEPAVEELNRLERGAADLDWLNEFLEYRVRPAWQDRGYFKVLVDGRAVPRGTDATHQHFSVILHVEEGPQYRLGSIQFRAAHYSCTTVSEDKPTICKEQPEDNPAPPDLPVFPADELRSLIPMQEGDLLSVDKIRKGLDALRKLYGSHGYIDFTPTPETEVDDVKQVVNIMMVLDERKQYRVHNIDVQGLDARTRIALVWKLQPGDVFNYDLLKQFFTDNQSLLPEGSSDINPEISRNVPRGTADILLRFPKCPQAKN